MNFTLFELACELQAALKEVLTSAWEHDSEPTYAVPDDAIAKGWAALAKAEAAGIVARPTEQAWEGE